MNKRVHIIAAVGFAFFLESAIQAANINEFADFSLRSGTTTLLPGRLYIPPEAIADPNRTRPLMVFLHGAGAVGTNNTTPVQHTPRFMLDEAKRRGAFLYVPQTSSSWSPNVVLDRVMTMIDRAVADLNADNDRLHLIGSSLGGGGVWHLLSRHANRFATALSVAGLGPGAGFAPANFRGTSIMALHARDDAVVSVYSSRGAVNKILAAAGEAEPNYPLRSNQVHWVLSNPALETHRAILDAVPPAESLTKAFTSNPELDLLYFEMATGGHSGPTAAFYEPLIYDWMFSHGTPVPEPSSVGLLLFGCCAVVQTRRLSRRRRKNIDSSCRPGLTLDARLG